MPDEHRVYLLGLGVKTILIIPLVSGGQVNGRLTFRLAQEREMIAGALGDTAGPENVACGDSNQKLGTNKAVFNGTASSALLGG